MLINKLKEWVKRYGTAEVIGLIFAVLGANVSFILTKNIILSAFIGTWTENIGFYGTIAYNDLKNKKNKPYLKQTLHMIIEFGPAEYIDSFLIRPLYLSFFPYIITNYSLAILVATILANITYYIPTIISYEIKKKLT